MSAAMDRSFVRVLSQTTWEAVASLQLDQNEVGCTIASIEHPTEDGAEVRLSLSTLHHDVRSTAVGGREHAVVPGS